MIEYSFNTFESDFSEYARLLDISCSDDEIQAYTAYSKFGCLSFMALYKQMNVIRVYFSSGMFINTF